MSAHPGVALSIAYAALFLFSPTAVGDALARLKPEKLEAIHQAIDAYRTSWRKLARAGPYVEYRANLHVHSALSHDSRGTLDEIVKAAKATGTRVLMFTEHPAEHYDYYRDGHKGIKDGILLIPGAESNGFLVFPTRSLRGLTTHSPQEFADLGRRGGGLVFLSHLEERMNWEILGLTGVEIYNTHADFKDEKNLVAALRNPLWVFKSAELFRKYPQEAFSALLDYPADYLKRWDQLCEKFPHTGVAANDAHQNVGLIVRLIQKDKVRLEDGLGKPVFEIGTGKWATLDSMCKGKKVGDAVFQIRLDPYDNSLRHVGTHLLMKELSEPAVREALQSGRAFVAFDWLADASGFNVAVVCNGRRHEMGSRLTFAKGMLMHGQAPLVAQWKLVRQGQVLSESIGSTLDVPISEPGNYRVEVWLKVGGENMIWILSNPFYVRPASLHPG